MGEWFEGVIGAIIGWVSANAVWIGTLSLAYFLVSLFAIRFLVIWIPPRYFMDPEVPAIPLQSPAVATILKIGKNLGGVLVMMIGLIMSIPGVPGQGIITVLLGLSLTDFPGKRSLEIRLVRQPLIFRTITSIREKAGKPRLELPDGEGLPTGDGSRPGDRS